MSGHDIVTALIASKAMWATLAVVVVGIVALVTQRKPIGELIRRIIKVGPKGVVTLATSAEEQKAPSATPLDPRRAADELLRGLDNVHIASVRASVQQDLERRGLGESAPADTIRVLMGYVASLFVIVDFERIDNVIWGSQLRILSDLNVAQVARLPEVRPYYEDAARTFPEAFEHYPFDEYMGFLKSQGLVLQEQDRILITPKGKAFLMYLVHESRSLRRPF